MLVVRQGARDTITTALITYCFMSLLNYSIGMYSHRVVSVGSQLTREVPRVLTIYDIDTPLPEAKSSIRSQFEKYGSVKDERVIGMLVEKGYMDLEETLLQYKQRSHLLRNLSLNTEMMGSMRKRLGKDSTIEEQFSRGY